MTIRNAIEYRQKADSLRRIYCAGLGIFRCSLCSDNEFVYAGKISFPKAMTGGNFRDFSEGDTANVVPRSKPVLIRIMAWPALAQLLAWPHAKPGLMQIERSR